MSVAKASFAENSSVILTSLGYRQLAALPMHSAVYTMIGVFSAMVITPFLVFLVQPIIQGRACNEPPLSHTAIWNGSAPQQPHQGGYADSQVSRRFLEIE